MNNRRRVLGNADVNAWSGSGTSFVPKKAVDSNSSLNKADAPFVPQHKGAGHGHKIKFAEDVVMISPEPTHKIDNNGNRENQSAYLARTTDAGQTPFKDSDDDNDEGNSDNSNDDEDASREGNDEIFRYNYAYDSGAKSEKSMVSTSIDIEEESVLMMNITHTQSNEGTPLVQRDKQQQEVENKENVSIDANMKTFTPSSSSRPSRPKLLVEDSTVLDGNHTAIRGTTPTRSTSSTTMKSRRSLQTKGVTNTPIQIYSDVNEHEEEVATTEERIMESVTGTTSPLTVGGNMDNATDGVIMRRREKTTEKTPLLSLGTPASSQHSPAMNSPQKASSLQEVNVSPLVTARCMNIEASIQKKVSTDTSTEARVFIKTQNSHHEANTGTTTTQTTTTPRDAQNNYLSEGGISLSRPKTRGHRRGLTRTSVSDTIIGNGKPQELPPRPPNKAHSDDHVPKPHFAVRLAGETVISAPATPAKHNNGGNITATVVDSVASIASHIQDATVEAADIPTTIKHPLPMVLTNTGNGHGNSGDIGSTSTDAANTVMGSSTTSLANMIHQSEQKISPQQSTTSRSTLSPEMQAMLIPGMSYSSAYADDGVVAPYYEGLKMAERAVRTLETSLDSDIDGNNIYHQGVPIHVSREESFSVMQHIGRIQEKVSVMRSKHIVLSTTALGTPTRTLRGAETASVTSSSGYDFSPVRSPAVVSDSNNSYKYHGNNYGHNSNSSTAVNSFISREYQNEFDIFDTSATMENDMNTSVFTEGDTTVSIVERSYLSETMATDTPLFAFQKRTVASSSTVNVSNMEDDDMKEITMNCEPGSFTTLVLSFKNKRKQVMTIDPHAILVRFDEMWWNRRRITGSSVEKYDEETSLFDPTTQPVGTIFQVSPQRLQLEPGESSNLYLTFAPEHSHEGIYGGALKIRARGKSHVFLLRGEAKETQFVAESPSRYLLSQTTDREEKTLSGATQEVENDHPILVGSSPMHEQIVTKDRTPKYKTTPTPANSAGQLTASRTQWLKNWVRRGLKQPMYSTLEVCSDLVYLRREDEHTSYTGSIIVTNRTDTTMAAELTVSNSDIHLSVYGAVISARSQLR